MNPLRRETPSTDEELVSRSRRGDTSAYAELWRRHSRAGLRAGQGFKHLADPDDLVAEAFTRIYRALLCGKGPQGAFRPYLYITIRNIALRNVRDANLTADYDLDLLEAPVTGHADVDLAFDTDLTVSAFRTLPERWQTVLWYTEVEQMSNAEAGKLMGLKPNAISALSFRARNALRAAWLQAHISAGQGTGEHREIIAKLGDYAQGTLSARDDKAVREHLAGCARCRRLYDEIDQVVGRLAIILLPLVLGVSGAAVFASSVKTTTETSLAAVRDPGPTVGGSIVPAAAHSGALLVTGVSVGAALVVAAVTVGLTTVPASQPVDIAAHSVAESSVSSTASSDEVASPDPQPTPLAPPAVSAPIAKPPTTKNDPAPTIVAPPADPVVTPVDTIAPAAPTVVTSWSPTDTSAPALHGTGEPGDTVTVSDAGGVALSTVTVDSAGQWQTPVLSALAPTSTHVDVVESDAAGNLSPTSVAGPFAFVPMFTSPADGAELPTSVVTVTLDGWAGSTIVLNLNGVPFGPFVFDGSGSMTRTVSLDGNLPLTPGSYTLTAYYGDGSSAPVASSTLTFTVTQ